MTTLSGRYALVRQLGSGGSSIIFEATDLKLNRPVAVKVVAPDSPNLQNDAARLQREGRIAAGLSHPNIYSVTDIDWLDSGLPYLVLELLVGETLAQRLDRVRALTVPQTLEIGEQLLAGLAAAHVRGIVHRDIKPANVFLVNVGLDRTVVKLIDFGIARVPQMLDHEEIPLTETGHVVGTPEYMSPEQVRGLRDFDARTDVYAAGVVLYEMLSGVRPFNDRSTATMLEAIAFEAIPPIATIAPHVPPSIAHAIDVALSKDRDRRHADANAFLRALRSLAIPTKTGVTQVVVSEAAEEWDMVTAPQVNPPTASVDVLFDTGQDTASVLTIKRGPR
jgi:eukaryotic-like serine/threonine-protein kinase